MIHMYDLICSNSDYFDQLIFNEVGDIFIDYICPIEEKKIHALCSKNVLMYVVKGEKHYDTIDYYHRAMKHQLIFVRKGGLIAHQFFNENYRALMFMFDDTTMNELVEEYSGLLGSRRSMEGDFSKYPTIVELNSNSFIKSIFTSSLDYLKTPTRESVLSLEIKFKELFINILRDKQSDTFKKYVSWLCGNTDVSFVQLMKENGHYNLTTNELARLACMSLSTFKREFARKMGTSPGKWLHKKRMEKAVALLKGTEKPIAEIAFDLEYNDTSAFSKAFKQSKELSPTEFRENLED